jgi:hypothetical protein
MLLLGVVGLLAAVVFTVLIYVDLARYCTKMKWLISAARPSEDVAFEFKSELTRKLSLAPFGIGSAAFIVMMLIWVFTLEIPRPEDFNGVMFRLAAVALIHGMSGASVLWWRFHGHLMPARDSTESDNT